MRLYPNKIADNVLIPDVVTAAADKHRQTMRGMEEAVLFCFNNTQNMK